MTWLPRHSPIQQNQILPTTANLIPNNVLLARLTPVGHGHHEDQNSEATKPLDFRFVLKTSASHALIIEARRESGKWHPGPATTNRFRFRRYSNLRRLFLSR